MTTCVLVDVSSEVKIEGNPSAFVAITWKASSLSDTLSALRLKLNDIFWAEGGTSLIIDDVPMLLPIL